MSRARTVSLDVREDLRQGRHPFAKIMQAVSSLDPDQDLRLLAPFEPTPLYPVLAGHGLTATPKQLPSGDWEIRFSQGTNDSTSAPESGPAPTASSAATPAVQPMIDVDARGLEPPGPLVKILEGLANLPAGSGLRAHTDRRPMHLYAHLEQRGLAWETTEQSDGSFITTAHPVR